MAAAAVAASLLAKVLLVRWLQHASALPISLAKAAYASAHAVPWAAVVMVVWE